MASTASFRVLKNELLKVLKQLQRVEKSAKKKLSTLEVTIIDNSLQLAIPGIQLNINAATKGSAKFTVRLWYFADIIKAEPDNTLHFDLTENRLNLRTLSFPVMTTFFETDSILRSINLPLNYTDMDLAKLLLSGKYTDEEIVINNLDQEAYVLSGGYAILLKLSAGNHTIYYKGGAPAENFTTEQTFNLKVE